MPFVILGNYCFFSVKWTAFSYFSKPMLFCLFYCWVFGSSLGGECYHLVFWVIIVSSLYSMFLWFRLTRCDGFLFSVFIPFFGVVIPYLPLPDVIWSPPWLVCWSFLLCLLRAISCASHCFVFRCYVSLCRSTLDLCFSLLFSFLLVFFVYACISINFSLFFGYFGCLGSPLCLFCTILVELICIFFPFSFFMLSSFFFPLFLSSVWFYDSKVFFFHPVYFVVFSFIFYFPLFLCLTL